MNKLDNLTIDKVDKFLKELSEANVGKVEETDNDWVNNYIKSINKQD